MRRTAAIALGSNLASQWGDREANLREAVARVAKLGEVRGVSSFYETAPVGFTDQPNFLNGAMLLQTELEPLELMRALLAIERAMGRDRAVVTDAAQSGTAPIKGPRAIDLDLLLMDDIVLASVCGPDNQPKLTLPHPAMAQRRFVLEPLAEIAPTLVDPLSGRTVAEMLTRLT
jgi:2-amino-4-hydroxy-6-hydroxymethyldihydropteridine diphosphokinase